MTWLHYTVHASHVWCFPDLLVICMFVSGGTVTYGLFHSVLPVPVPVVNIFPPGVESAYAGSQLTLICSIVLDFTTLFSILGDLVVTSVWTGPSSGVLSGDGRVTVSPASQQGITTTFTSTVMFNTLRISDAGTYTCEATVAPRGSTAGTVTNGVGSAIGAVPTIQSMYACYLHYVASHLTIVTILPHVLPLELLAIMTGPPFYTIHTDCAKYGISILQECVLGMPMPSTNFSWDI